MWYNRTMNYKNKSGTYTITNDTNGKIYYGSSQDIGIRWKEHRCALRRGDHHCSHLQNSWNKHGAAAFTFAVFDYCEVEDLYPYEQILLDLHVGKDYCYNTAKDAKAPFKGRKHTEESKVQISKSQIGKTHSEETKRRQSEAKKGKKNPFFGKTHSAKTKQQMVKAHKGKKKPKAACPHCGILASAPNLARWHGDKCKNKENK